MFAWFLSPALAPDVYARIGTTSTFQEFCLGRSGEPLANATLYLSKDLKWAGVEASNGRGAYFFETAKPKEYVHFRFYPVYDPKKKLYDVIPAGKGGENPVKQGMRTWGGFNFGVVLGGKVVCSFSGLDQKGTQRTIFALVDPFLKSKPKVLYAAEEYLGHGPLFSDSENRILFRKEGKTYRLHLGGPIKLLGLSAQVDAGLANRRFRLDGLFEIDTRTGKRNQVLKAGGGGSRDSGWYWGNQLIGRSVVGDYFWWDRTSQRRERIDPYLPVFGTNSDGSVIVFMTDNRPGVVRSHKMLKLNPGLP